MFQSKILDKEYCHIVDNCLDDASISVEDCMNKIHSKFSRSNPSTSRPSRQANNAKNQGGNQKKNDKYWIDPEVWKKMTPEQKQEHLRKKRNNNNNKGNSREKQGTSKSVPSSNYSHSNKQVATILKTLVETLEEQAEDNTQENTSDRKSNNTTVSEEAEEPKAPDLREILRTQIRTTNVSRVIYAHQSQSKQEKCLATVDSGADTCLLGRAFHIVSRDEMRTVEVHGFNEE